LVLGALGLSQTVYAPPAAEAALILAIVTTSYIPETQEFEVELSIHCGIAKAGQKADFTIATELVIEPSSGSPEVILVGSKVKDVIRSASCNASGDELGRIKVQFPWDRNGGTVEGPVNVGVEAKILNPAGKAIGNGGDSEEFVVEVGPPNTPPTITSVTITPNQISPSGGIFSFGNLEHLCAATADDADGDLVEFSFKWFDENGIQIGSDEVLPADSNIGTTICEVTPFDGTDFGDPVSLSILLQTPTGGGGV